MAIRELDSTTLDNLRQLVARGVPVPVCEECGEPRPSRTRYCSERCKQRRKRDRKNPRPGRWVTCRYCEDEFHTQNQRQVACHPAEASAECFRARDAATYVKEDSAGSPCQGPGCENSVGGAETGRRRDYCSRSCQAKAYRERKAQR